MKLPQGEVANLSDAVVISSKRMQGLHMVCASGADQDPHRAYDYRTRACDTAKGP